jgi:c-di-GMP-binding flagellar brake protein YcgR
MHPDLTAKAYEEMRVKKRFDVNLEAIGTFVGYEKNKYRFIISNLSASGARLHFETALDVKIGRSLVLEIFLPKTILTIPNTAEIMRVTRKGNVVTAGVKFKDILSEIMMNSLTEAKATV